ncbi:2,5-diamino-6-hydroxy-4-(5-phosphoribosylamino)pyrimidine 1'-reductase [Aciduliprofundum sp. MAR08-339]|uniref:2,5-diamino-6-(ribosylamino)-4(3H)-pyrimidinone 5'-phosphate reductase n=1 Tax=Aciduliprofundum sp. (strain MAR08-339) TaxID=673860 RepID=UPI0002A4A37D|nr:2,5-diamino-6-hydroxy-4-(5-phosphoribosylamino)pyrimidine 1'-reductase [Aciduliprofundum sp. MAR08-339]
MRPRVIVNAAMSVDGKIALVGGRRIKISDEEDFRRVHHLRASVDAILVGINTIIKDDPKLTVKEKFVPDAKNPVRIVLDSKLRIPENARVLNDMAPTIIATTKDAPPRDLNAEIIRCGYNLVDLHCLMEELWKREIGSVMVEGGSTVISSFLREGLVDELNVFVGSMIIGGDAPTLVSGKGARFAEETIKLKLLECKPLGYGVLLRYGVNYESG